MYTPEISNSDISRITTQDGYYTFTIGKAQYRTDKNGEGLWRYQASGTNMMDGEKVWEWQQILGTTQFTVGSNPRASVALFALQGDPAYIDWLKDEGGLTPSKSTALKFLRLN